MFMGEFTAIQSRGIFKMDWIPHHTLLVGRQILIQWAREFPMGQACGCRTTAMSRWKTLGLVAYWSHLENS